jgi:hypothetical protein
MPRNKAELMHHLFAMHAMPAERMGHRTLDSLDTFHRADHVPGFGPKFTSFIPHTHANLADPTQETNR